MMTINDRRQKENIILQQKGKKYILSRWALDDKTDKKIYESIAYNSTSKI